jgi:hypothetical protein
MTICLTKVEEDSSRLHTQKFGQKEIGGDVDNTYSKIRNLADAKADSPFMDKGSSEIPSI